MPLNEREHRLCDLIANRHAALIEDLRVHVGLQTGGRNVAALDETRALLTARAAALGATTELAVGVPRPSWLYGELPGQPTLPTAISRRNSLVHGGREILLAGHLDTVHDPLGSFRALVIAGDGRTATGPGCVDMKGGLVIALAALEALEEVGARLNWTLMLNSDEETGSYHSAPTILAEAARVSARGGLGIALEPATTDGGLVVERAGSAQFCIHVQGKSAHVGRDFAAGVSAVNELAAMILQVAGMSDLAIGVLVNVGPIQGGSATNVVPENARVWGNVRFPNAQAAARVLKQLQALAGTRPSGAVVSVESSVGRPAKPTSPEVQAFAENVRKAAADLRQPLPFSKTAGVCDGNLMQSAGLPTLDTLGVRGDGLHTPREWIDLSSLVERCQLLALTILRASAGFAS